MWDHIGVGWGGSCRGGVVIQGWVGKIGVRWVGHVRVGWVGHVGVGWVIHHLGVGWVIQVQ